MPSGPVCAKTEVGARTIARSVARAAIPAPARREFLIFGNMAGLRRDSCCGRPGRGLPIEAKTNNGCRDGALGVFHIFGMPRACQSRRDLSDRGKVPRNQIASDCLGPAQRNCSSQFVDQICRNQHEFNRYLIFKHSNR